MELEVRRREEEEQKKTADVRAATSGEGEPDLLFRMCLVCIFRAEDRLRSVILRDVNRWIALTSRKIQPKPIPSG